MKKDHIMLLCALMFAQYLNAQSIKVTSFSPSKGAPGTLVTIYGSGFSAYADSDVVNFGAVRASVSHATTTRLSVTVPYGASYKPITVSNKITGLIARSALPFTTAFYPTNTDIDKPVRIAEKTGASDVEIADIDGDGKPDIIATSPVQKTLMIFRNTSTTGRIDKKSFAPPVIYKTGPQSGFVAVEDLDGDGKVDITLINGSYTNGSEGYNSLTFFRNMSKPGHIKLSNFLTTDSLKETTPGDTLMLNTGDNYARLADFDGDGKTDLVVLNAVGFVKIYRNIYAPGQSGAFAPPVTLAVGSHSTSLSVGDIDGDGKPDIITANADSSSLTILRNTAAPGTISSSSFQRVDFPLGFRPFTTSLADIDGDGRSDLLVSRADGGSSVLIRNTSTPGHIAGYAVKLANMSMVANMKNDMVIHDLNGDGKPDLLSISGHRDSVYLYTNKFTEGANSNYFNEREDFAIASLPDCIGDLDGDGRPDLIVSTRFGIDIYHSRAAHAQTQSSLLAADRDSLFVPKAVSPNGDGINDVLVIGGIQKFPVNQLTIISADAVTVFEKKGYGSDGKLFDGHSNITSRMQSPGTFFYRLEYIADGQEKIKTGYFILKY